MSHLYLHHPSYLSSSFSSTSLLQCRHILMSHSSSFLFSLSPVLRHQSDKWQQSPHCLLWPFFPHHPLHLRAAKHEAKRRRHLSCAHTQLVLLLHPFSFSSLFWSALLNFWFLLLLNLWPFPIFYSPLHPLSSLRTNLSPTMDADSFSGAQWDRSESLGSLLHWKPMHSLPFTDPSLFLSHNDS